MFHQALQQSTFSCGDGLTMTYIFQMYNVICVILVLFPFHTMLHIVLHYSGGGVSDEVK